MNLDTILETVDGNQSIRCAWCIADAVHDAEIGTTAGDSRIASATTIANGHALCLDHFRISRKHRTGSAGPVALEVLRGDA